MKRNPTPNPDMRASDPSSTTGHAWTRPSDNATAPTFLVLGAGKSGTTSLWRYLNQHPDVFLPDVKEPNFFALMGETIPDPADDPEDMHHYLHAVTTWADYRMLFDGAGDATARGEVSPMYLYHPKAAECIRRFCPHAKLIAVLRHPADRLFSRWQHLLADGRPPSEDITDAFDRDSIWWRRNDLVPEGMYGRHLQRYFARFPREQIRVVLFEDFVADPDAVMRSLFRFLGVDPAVPLDTRTRHNTSARVESPLLRGLIGRNGSLKRWIARRVPDHWTPTARTVLTDLRRRFGRRDALAPSVRRRLIRDIYRPDILRLEGLLERDLSHWLA